MSGFGNYINEDGVTVQLKPEATMRYMKRFIKPGLTLLKFGASGNPHERVFRLAGDMNTMSYQGGWISKLGRIIIIDTKKITSITKGQTTPQFSRQSKYFGCAKETSLTITFKDKRGRNRSLNLMAPNDEAFEYLFGALNAIVKKHLEKKSASSADSQYIEALWQRADKDKSGSLSQPEIIRLIQSMNINMPLNLVKNRFQKVDEDKTGTLSYDEFLAFLDLLRYKQEIDHVFNMIVTGESIPVRVRPLVFSSKSAKTESITIEQFCTFWRQTQGQDLTPAQVMKVVDIANPDLAAQRKKRLLTALTGEDEFKITFSMFSNVLQMADNDLFDLSKQPVYQDMTRPLSYYYIASSHNTYLEGDQLTSKASVKRYVDDVTNGCRCVEIDVWDGPFKEPVVTHGHTATTKITFRDVIQALGDFGFENNPYPIILSIEQHCSLEQQVVAAKILKSILGARLVMPRKNLTSSDTIPSPHELRGKFLVKGKRLGGELDIADEDDGHDFAEAAGHPGPKKTLTTGYASDILPEMSQLTYLGTGKVKKFDEESLLLPCDMMCSYSENAVFKNLTSKYQEAWIQHNKNHLSRVYPKGLRVNSSNYIPTPAWALGCQCVALNYQTGDDAMHVNMGKFRENGGVGYVLKPESMINTVAEMSPSIKLSINIISGSQLPKPMGNESGEIIDPYVVVSISGEAQDSVEFTTSTIQDNGFNPVWNQVRKTSGLAC